MENGIYKSPEAIYYVKDEKIMMQIKGNLYKTSKNFMFGTKVKDMSEQQLNQFDAAYEQVKKW